MKQYNLSKAIDKGRLLSKIYAELLELKECTRPCTRLVRRHRFRPLRPSRFSSLNIFPHFTFLILKKNISQLSYVCELL